MTRKYFCRRKKLKKKKKLVAWVWLLMDIIYDIGSPEAVNKKGLRRAKKEPQQLEQQDACVAQWPFGQSPKLALACVFDGHGGESIFLSS